MGVFYPAKSIDKNQKNPDASYRGMGLLFHKVALTTLAVCGLISGNIKKDYAYVLSNIPVFLFAMVTGTISFLHPSTKVTVNWKEHTPEFLSIPPTVIGFKTILPAPVREEYGLSNYLPVNGIHTYTLEAGTLGQLNALLAMEGAVFDTQSNALALSPYNAKFFAVTSFLVSCIAAVMKPLRPHSQYPTDVYCVQDDFITPKRPKLAEPTPETQEKMEIDTRAAASPKPLAAEPSKAIPRSFLPTTEDYPYRRYHETFTDSIDDLPRTSGHVFPYFSGCIQRDANYARSIIFELALPTLIPDDKEARPAFLKTFTKGLDTCMNTEMGMELTHRIFVLDAAKKCAGKPTFVYSGKLYVGAYVESSFPLIVDGTYMEPTEGSDLAGDLRKLSPLALAQEELLRYMNEEMQVTSDMDESLEITDIDSSYKIIDQLTSNFKKAEGVTKTELQAILNKINVLQSYTPMSHATIHDALHMIVDGHELQPDTTYFLHLPTIYNTLVQRHWLRFGPTAPIFSVGDKEINLQKGREASEVDTTFVHKVEKKVKGKGKGAARVTKETEETYKNLQFFYTRVSAVGEAALSLQTMIGSGLVMQPWKVDNLDYKSARRWDGENRERILTLLFERVGGGSGIKKKEKEEKPKKVSEIVVGKAWSFV